MSTTHHIHLSVRGALRNPKPWVGNIAVEGCALRTVTEVKKFLEYQLSIGHEVLPCGECEGFDYIKGCPGHEREEAPHDNE